MPLDENAKGVNHALGRSARAFFNGLLVDSTRQWFKARVGLAAAETPRDLAFCAHAIANEATLVVPDALADERFCDNPLVTQAPDIRAYLGAPIVDSQGHHFGTVCAIDQKTHVWTAHEIAQLEGLAAIVSTMLNQRAAVARAVVLAEEVRALSDQVQLWQAFVEETSQAAKVGGWSFDVATSQLTWTNETLRIHKVPDGFVPTLDNIAAFYEPQAQATMNAAIKQAIAHHTPWDIELPLLTAGGERIWVRTIGKVFVDNGKVTRLYGAIQDIGAQREQRLQLEEAKDRAEAATRAKSLFLANMSHEVRTPLNGVIGLAGALQRTSLDGAQLDMVRYIQTSGESLERVVSDLLDLSKIEAGKLDLADTPFDLQDTILAATSPFRVQADTKGLSFVVAVAPEAQGFLRGDGLRLRQIVSNLVSNAVKFTAHGQVRVDVRLSAHGAAAPQVLIEVSDTGVGFDEDAARRLFTRFEQAHSTTAQLYGGTGLGLAISRSLAEMMGGSLSATSVVGQGSCFTVLLPLPRVAEPAQAPALADSGPSPAPELNASFSILVAEDNPTNRFVMKTLLEPLGASVTLVANGREALETFIAQPFDLVLLDMCMPELNGLEAAKLMREAEAAAGEPRTPIGMLSANAYGEHIESAMKAGCDTFIAKPLTPTSLFVGLRTLIGLRAATAEAA
jgi:signal transduction histidine kinase/ActR/RegA family two-component response regulator